MKFSPGLTYFKTLFYEEKPHVIALFIITLWAFLIRLGASFQPMRYDEAYTFLEICSPPVPWGILHYDAPNNHVLA